MVPTLPAMQNWFPIGTLVLGAALTALFGEWRTSRDHRRERSSGLREERASAYRNFIVASHETAHRMGRCAPGCPQPLTDHAERIESFARVDSVVAKTLYELELFAEAEALEAAREMRAALSEFRNVIEAGAVYWEDEYLGTFELYRNARGAFIEAARTEILAS